MFFLIFILNIFIASGNDGTYYLNKGLENKENYAEAEVNFKTAIELFRKERKNIDVAVTYYYLAYLNEVFSKFEPSIIYYNKSLAISKNENDLELVFKCNERLSNIYIYLNNFSKSIKHIQSNNEMIKNRSIDSIYNNRHYYVLAFYYYSINEYNNAIHTLHQIDTNNLIDFKLDYYNMIASIYTNINDEINANKYYELIYNLDSTDNTYLMNYIKFLYEIEDSTKGEKLYNKHLNLNSSALKIERNQNTLLHSEVLYYRGEYHKSLLLLDSIRPFFEENKMYSRLAECLVVYKNNYKNLKRYEDYDRVVEEIIKVKDNQFRSQMESISKINDALFNLEKENLELSHQNDIYTLTTYSTIAIFILTIVVVIIAFIKRRKTNEYKQKIKQIDAENQALKDIIDNDFHNALDSYHETIYSNLDANKDSKVFNDFDKLVKIKKQINDFLSNRNKKIF